MMGAYSYLGGSTNTFSALTSGYTTRSTTILDGNGSIYTTFYIIYVPTTYDPTVQNPMILSMHGSGEEGFNDGKQLTVGFGHYLSAVSSTWTVPVCFPQFPDPNSIHSIPGLDDGTTPLYLRTLCLTCFQKMTQELHPDPTRYYVLGNSMGGIHTWGQVYLNPTYWAAALPESGNVSARLAGQASDFTSANSNMIAVMGSTFPIKFSHGTNDSDVSEALDAQTASQFGLTPVASPTGTHTPLQEYVRYGGLDHGQTWVSAFSAPETWSWLFSQHR